MSKAAYQKEGFLYVDDTDLIATNKGDESSREVVTRAQILLDRWKTALKITGGDLKFEKCF